MSNPKPDQIDWTQEPFKAVIDAVVAEASRTAVAAKFLPPHGPVSEARPVPSDIITKNDSALTIDSNKTTPFVDIRVQFILTKPQYDEPDLTTAMTLATRAANLLVQAQDLVIFQGRDAPNNEFFKKNPVFLGSGASPFPIDLRGLFIDADNPAIPVPPKPATATAGLRYGEHTSSAVSKAYSLLQKLGHNGPYVLVLHSDVYADTIEPLEDTLIMPADRIKFFVTETDTASGKDIVRFYGTGALEPQTGLFMSLGGNSMDVVVLANSPTTKFLQPTTGLNAGLMFEVSESFTLRLKDATAVVPLQFETPA